MKKRVLFDIAKGLPGFSNPKMAGFVNKDAWMRYASDISAASPFASFHF